MLFDFHVITILTGVRWNIVVFIWIPLDRVSLTSPFLTCIALIYFSCQIALAKTPRTILNSSGESRYPYLALHLSGNTSNFPIFNMMTAECWSYWFGWVEVCSFYIQFVSFFFHERVFLYFIICLLYSDWDNHMVLFFDLLI